MVQTFRKYLDGRGYSNAEIEHIQRVRERIVRTYNIRNWRDIDEVLSVVYALMDQTILCDEKQRMVNVETLKRDLVYLRLYAEYIVNEEKSGKDLIESLKENEKYAALLQRAPQQCIKDLTPNQSFLIRNQVVARLRAKQSEIDRFIDGYRVKPNKARAFRFGEDVLRNWLDAAMRFVNVPHRTQVTQKMILGNQTRFVSKLVFRNNRYYRVWFLDKSGAQTAHKPIIIPLDDVLSTYLHFYLEYCRPKVESSYVFPTKNGNEWTRISASVKKYLVDDLKLNIGEVIRNHDYFLHRARTLVIEAYGTKIRFNYPKLQRFATLMRHTSYILERRYSIWIPWYQAKQAAHKFAEDNRLKPAPNLYEDTDTTERAVTTLRAPKASVFQFITQKMKQKDEKLNSNGLSKASYETIVLKHGTFPKELQQDDTLPFCCGAYMHFKGPNAQNRYYARCSVCKRIVPYAAKVKPKSKPLI